MCFAPCVVAKAVYKTLSNFVLLADSYAFRGPNCESFQMRKTAACDSQEKYKAHMVYETESDDCIDKRRWNE